MACNMRAMDINTASTSAHPLSLPITGQALRQAVARHDVPALTNLAGQLRIAGFRVDTQRLIDDLLRHGCTSLIDPFGQRVPLQVSVPPASARLQVDQALPFRICA
ncbi:MAG: hypothetical protein C4K60_08945 [Ideonella sp. MAG2]|nr:MAG: hypothetical protein C4K60_08945 [Ideonella sp. MAG2]